MDHSLQLRCWFPYIAVEKHDVHEGGIPHVQTFSWVSDFGILSKSIPSSIQISVLIMILAESEREWWECKPL